MRLVSPLRRGAPVNHTANLNGCINGPYRQRWGQHERWHVLISSWDALVVWRSVPSIHLPFRFDQALRARDSLSWLLLRTLGLVKFRQWTKSL
jgi:hypothetical protein